MRRIGPGDAIEAISPLLEGLDGRPRPTSMRQRVIQGLKQSAPFSSLQRRIIFFNLVGLALLVFGVLILNSFLQGLIGERVNALVIQGEIIAITIAEQSANDPSEAPGFDPIIANTILNRLVQPTGVRARLFDRARRLVGDTRNLSPSGGPIEVKPLAPPTPPGTAGVIKRMETAYLRFLESFRDELEVYSEIPTAGISNDKEVITASRGKIDHQVRVNSEGELIVSVALPVRQFKTILGVLQLSTEGGAINDILRNERLKILQVFFVATMVSIALSVLLANTIARPIRRLAIAADNGGLSAARPLNPERVEIPDLTHRSDEIGDLSGSLIKMTEALYKRIDAIESFAADVAHEIKNPLTSLRSAVETMEYAKTPEQRQKLLDVIQKDVSRMDRLVTDISNASRLDAELVRERMEQFDLGALVEMLAGITRSQGEERNVSVNVRLPSGQMVARGLEGRIAQVVTNFLDNALSFSPDGGTITIEGIEILDGIRLSVSDQGPGIPQDSLANVFNRFYTERPESQGFGNHSGLGLAISKQIIEAHNGKIWAENVDSGETGPNARPAGARFVIELPV
ncbi:sensor histidine kinase [Rhodobacteraceae bacterium NNCM2]|nr:sensor histidine kinase [Coraliihabitans acroporae]